MFAVTFVTCSDVWIQVVEQVELNPKRRTSDTGPNQSQESPLKLKSKPTKQVQKKDMPKEEKMDEKKRKIRSLL